MVIYPSDKIEFNFTDFSSFREIVNEFSDDNVSAEKRSLAIDGQDEKSFSKISYGENSEILYKLSNGKEVKTILYIPTQMFPLKYFNVSNILIENLNRYHLFQCRTVLEIEKREVEFRLTTRDRGTFDYSFISNQREHLHHDREQPLFICKHCLEHFNIIHKSRLTKETFIPSYHLNY